MCHALIKHCIMHEKDTFEFVHAHSCVVVNDMAGLCGVLFALKAVQIFLQRKGF